ncbi:MAG: hypothetical protein K6A62_04560 [Bacteroidales bacterium]|nr:hypothetical protein [Bacteroidales bacterium]
MNTLQLTTKEKARAARNERIICDYQALRAEQPAAPSARIIRTIASTGKYNLSEEGIKQVLYRADRLIPRTRKLA